MAKIGDFPVLFVFPTGILNIGDSLQNLVSLFFSVNLKKKNNHGREIKEKREIGKMEETLARAGYDVKEWIGKGSYGSVARVMDAKRLELAAKVLQVRKSEAGGGGVPGEQVRELATHLELKHPNIVPINNVFRDLFSRELIIIMPLAQESFAKTLWRLDLPGMLDLFGRMVPAAAVHEKIAADIALRQRYARDIICGMQYLWDRGFTHLDLKPGNILLSSDDIVQIADFGFAQSRFRDTMSIEREPNRLATTPWRAPELQCGILSYDQRADYWALGLVLFELFFGVQPFQRVRDDELELIEEIGAKLGYPDSFLAQLLQDNVGVLPRSIHEVVGRLRTRQKAMGTDATKAVIGNLASYCLDIGGKYAKISPTPPFDTVFNLLSVEDGIKMEKYYGALFYPLAMFIGNLLQVDPNDRVLGSNVETVFGTGSSEGGGGCRRIIPSSLVPIRIEKFQAYKELDPGGVRLSDAVFLVAEHMAKRLEEAKKELPGAGYYNDMAILRLAAKLLGETRRADRVMTVLGRDPVLVDAAEFVIERALDFDAWKRALSPSSFSSSSSVPVPPIALAPATARALYGNSRSRRRRPRPVSAPRRSVRLLGSR